MEMIDAAIRFAESQGIAALLCIVILAQNHIYTKRIIEKNCELERFIMDCLRKELAEYDVPKSRGVPYDQDGPGSILAGVRDTFSSRVV